MKHPLVFTSISTIMLVSAAAHADTGRVRHAYNLIADDRMVLVSITGMEPGRFASLGEAQGETQTAALSFNDVRDRASRVREMRMKDSRAHIMADAAEETSVPAEPQAIETITTPNGELSITPLAGSVHILEETPVELQLDSDLMIDEAPKPTGFNGAYEMIRRKMNFHHAILPMRGTNRH